MQFVSYFCARALHTHTHTLYRQGKTANILHFVNKQIIRRQIDKVINKLMPNATPKQEITIKCRPISILATHATLQRES